MFKFLKKKSGKDNNKDKLVEQTKVEPQQDETTSTEPVNETVDNSTTVSSEAQPSITPDVSDAEQNQAEIPQANEAQSEHVPQVEVEAETAAAPEPEQAQPEPTKKTSWAKRLFRGLSKTRSQLSDRLGAVVLGKKTIDDDLLEDLETVLITADIGVDTTDYLLQSLTKQVKRKQLADPEALITALKQQLLDMLSPLSKPLVVDQKPFVILMVGVNGAGKTTSIAKLAHYYQQQGKSIMLAAGDTFRAAAVEQLQTWGQRNQVAVIAQQPGADSASVIFDAIQSTQAKNIDVLIADTAGRLHTQHNLMEELKKIKRVMAKQNEHAPHETLLVIDASLGQNSLNQAKAFTEAVDVTGLCITKLDGTAKGGIIFSIARELGLPIRFIGVGENMDDLQPFNATEFIDALWQE